MPHKRGKDAKKKKEDDLAERWKLGIGRLLKRFSINVKKKGERKWRWPGRKIKILYKYKNNVMFIFHKNHPIHIQQVWSCVPRHCRSFWRRICVCVCTCVCPSICVFVSFLGSGHGGNRRGQSPVACLHNSYHNKVVKQGKGTDDQWPYLAFGRLVAISLHRGTAFS